MNSVAFYWAYTLLGSYFSSSSFASSAFFFIIRLINFLSRTISHRIAYWNCNDSCSLCDDMIIIHFFSFAAFNNWTEPKRSDEKANISTDFCSTEFVTKKIQMEKCLSFARIIRIWDVRSSFSCAAMHVHTFLSFHFSWVFFCLITIGLLSIAHHTNVTGSECDYDISN